MTARAKRAASAGRKAGDGIGEAPLIALAGGLRDRRPDRRLAAQDRQGDGVAWRESADGSPDTARAAADAAKEAGKARLDELGLTRDAGAETLKSILKGAGDATKASAQAALSAVKDKK